MIQEVIKYCMDHMERYQIQRQIKALIWETNDRCYRTIEEANSKIQRLIELIEKAKSFNKRTSVKQIDVERFTNGVYILEQRIEDDYFSGSLPIR